MIYNKLKLNNLLIKFLNQDTMASIAHLSVQDIFFYCHFDIRRNLEFFFIVISTSGEILNFFLLSFRHQEKS
jgi:hypothetical protein